MPKYVIERDLAGAGSLTQDDLRAISQKSCNVLEVLGPKIQWVESYVTPDKVYCVYIAPDEALIRKHADSQACGDGRIPGQCNLPGECGD
ncbi:DUF4242 domain-containing protein [Vibrio fluvialis]|uniref:DUF4242 domain-containing protein n=1 Tax=Vibrio fluvialis TaxID=676 RepID=UPI001EEBE36C|nr:DUF4242 domain-containing protein [Vibrio fluvialis]